MVFGLSPARSTQTHPSAGGSTTSSEGWPMGRLSALRQVKLRITGVIIGAHPDVGR
jgi:hypothetical protein